jgi:hypothetical protein
MWQRDGLKPSAAVTQATKAYRGEMDFIQQWLDDRTIDAFTQQRFAESGIACDPLSAPAPRSSVSAPSFASLAISDPGTAVDRSGKFLHYFTFK